MAKTSFAKKAGKFLAELTLAVTLVVYGFQLNADDTGTFANSGSHNVVIVAEGGGAGGNPPPNP